MNSRPYDLRAFQRPESWGKTLRETLIWNSEVCNPSCVFKLYGEVNSVKKTTINIWLNDGVYQQWKNYMFSPITTIFRF